MKQGASGVAGWKRGRMMERRGGTAGRTRPFAPPPLPFDNEARRTVASDCETFNVMFRFPLQALLTSRDPDLDTGEKQEVREKRDLTRRICTAVAHQRAPVGERRQFHERISLG